MAGGWLLLAALAQGTGALDWPGVGLAIRLAGVVAGISLALLLQNVKVFAYLGSRTLPIYLAHTPLIVLMVFAIDPLVTSSALQHVKWALPIVLTAVAVALALLVQRLALKSPLRILYAPPPTVTAALNGRLSRPRRTVAGRVRPGLRAGPAEP